MIRVSVTRLPVLGCLSVYISLIVFICGHISTISLHLRFSSLVCPLMDHGFVLLYDGTLLSLFVCQAMCFTVQFIFLIVVTIYFQVLFLFDFPYCGCNHYSFYRISSLSSTMQYAPGPSLLPLLYSLMNPKLYSYTLKITTVLANNHFIRNMSNCGLQF